MNLSVTSDDVYLADRIRHHELALRAYKSLFVYRQFSQKYQKTSMQRLGDVFTYVQIADPKLPSIRRHIDTFDLINPLLAQCIVDACYRDLPNKSRAIACLKTIDRYCQFLKSSPTLHVSGQKPLYIPSIYGPIESPVGPYSIPVKNNLHRANYNYLTETEYKIWLKYTWQQISNASSDKEKLFASQLFVMCVIAGELGLRLQEILGLEPQFINFVDSECMVTWGKGTNGSGFRKRTVPITPMASQVVSEFLKQYPRKPDEPLFQNFQRQRLGKSTAHGMMRRLIAKMKLAGLALYLDRGFGWHGFRRTFTRMYLEHGGNVIDLKNITGWSYTSTISHYLGDEKPKQHPRQFLFPSKAQMIEANND